MKGLVDYLRCPTIRHKIFHPIFLFFKFDNVIDLYFNLNILKSKSLDNDTEFLNELFSKIFEIILPSHANYSKFIYNRLILLHVKANK